MPLDLASLEELPIEKLDALLEELSRQRDELRETAKLVASVRYKKIDALANPKQKPMRASPGVAEVKGMSVGHAKG